MADELETMLLAHNATVLNQMAAFQRLTQKGPRSKAETSRLLVEALLDPKRLKTALASLSAPERAALEAVQRAGGQLSTRSLRENLKQQGLLEKTGAGRGGRPDPQLERPRRLEDIVARLCLRGLLWPGVDFKRGGGQPALPVGLRDFQQDIHWVFIPAPLSSLLPPPPPLAAMAVAAPAVGSAREGSARAFQRDLYLYWSYVRRQPLSLTAKGEPRKAQLKDVNATLLVRVELGKGETELDHPRLRFLRLLLGALDLLETHGDTVTATDATDFFALPAAERVKRTFEAWRDGVFWSDLLLIPTNLIARGSAAIQVADRDLIAARRLVVEYVASQPSEIEWLAFDTLADQVRGTDYEFLFSRRVETSYSYSPYYGVTHPYSSYGNRLGLEFNDIRNEEDGWDKVEANFIRTIIAGPLHWLGLVDLGWAGAAPTTPAEAYRLTALGRWVLGHGPQPDIPAEGGRVIVQPNLHIVALDPVVDATLVTLDRFAERLSAERAVEYRLTRASVYAGQRQGWEVPRIKDFLRAQTGADLPGNVARTLDEWQAQHERIVLYPRVVLAHGLPAALDALAAHPQAGGLVGARLTPALMRLAGANALPGVVQALGEGGVLPVVTPAATVSPASVEADEDGALRLLARQPSLYLHGHLAAFADPAGDGAYALTPATVQRAARAGLTAPQLIARLEAVHRGPLPAGLPRRIRAWAKHYGTAALEAPTLLQVRDAATLNELLADPELAALLQPFRPTASKALARVKAKDVDKLRALLEERGIDLEDKLS